MGAIKIETTNPYLYFVNLKLNIVLALRAITSNKLRTILTFMIIAVGIMALVGILTAIESMKTSIISNFSSVGVNSFTIRSKGLTIKKGGAQAQAFPHISYEEARDFKTHFTYPAQVSISNRPSTTSTLKFEYEKTNPNITVMGVDGLYAEISGYQFNQGRNFSNTELEIGSNVIILGEGVVNTLFNPSEKIIDKYVTIGNIKYRVVGSLASKGSSMVSSDNMVLIPMLNARKFFPDKANRFTITVAVNHPSQLDNAAEEATGTFRNIRKVGLREEDNFEIKRSDKLANTVLEQMSNITMAATLIGIITMLGAGIGLMNIMLVSVSERTREIGISKALGANNDTIKKQFLVEAILICQIGGIAGIILGVLAGNAVSFLLGVDFIIPWLWVSVGFGFCFIIGLLAGIYPAIKASKLDPIEALRYE